MSASPQKSTASHKTKRLLKLLSKSQRDGMSYRMESGTIEIFLGSKSFAFREELVRQLKKQGKLKIGLKKITITSNGVRYLKAIFEPNLGDPIPERKVMAVEVEICGVKSHAIKNINESPLERLYHRKSKAGVTYISDLEYAAGERLRKDFERGQLQPKISANLTGAVGSASRSISNSSAEISDFALDASKRVGDAVDSLGPELSGVAVDICCYLKGLELVERERKWPPRSAKLMLKTGLSILVRHYGLSGNFNHRNRSKSHWGSDDFRPAMTT